MSSVDPNQPNADFPTSGRIAAFDYGTVRIGIAVCDPDRILASPLEVHPAANWRDDADYFRSLIQSERIVGIVVGLPIHCDGGESEKSKEAREFAKWLAAETSLPVRMFDERFTTADANRRLGGNFTRAKKKRRIDAIAALVLLDSFIEACRYRQTIAGQTLDADPDGGESLDA
ncbi:MAG: Holliday junction resolvase RuvX [Rhodopirellula sp.]|nr:Holliday junction resolvase RuvX [Rhodopirellula sp.]